MPNPQQHGSNFSCHNILNTSNWIKHNFTSEAILWKTVETINVQSVTNDINDQSQHFFQSSSVTINSMHR